MPGVPTVITELTAALVLVRLAVPSDPEEAGTWLADGRKRDAVILALNLLPFAGIAFLWFIGVVRDQMGDVEDRLFSTVFLGSGLLFLAMLFQSAVTTTSVMGGLTGPSTNVDLYEFGRSSTQTLISVYAMRMAGVFTLSVSTLALRTGALPRWIPVTGYVVALLLMVAAGEHKWVQLVFPLWVLLVSVAILVTRPAART